MVFAHFPIILNISNGGKTIEIRNFIGIRFQIYSIGEKHNKKIELLPGCKVRKSESPKDQIEVEGIDLENVSLSCTIKIVIFRCINQPMYASKKEGY